MPVLGKFLSQQLGFTVTTTAGTVYTHSLGFTPTFVSVIAFGNTICGCGYTAPNSNAVTIVAASGASAAPLADVLCGALHSIIQ